MGNDYARVLEGLLASARFLNGGEIPEFLQAADQRCGRGRLRQALTAILGWLRYIGRGGREKDAKKFESTEGRRAAPFEAVSMLLDGDGLFSELFELNGSLLMWRSSIPESERVLIVKEIAEKWVSPIRV
ncbi:hypothetical protein [Myxococcus sp. CA039A]|uniref:hypothetical protein n=1 Tax=Myxococcus sp. CA039A TaxID=2741737 RepID=UPI00157A952D|nr:hypothetical protein [Myxococcus sp. CA039A]NTX57416.1 hypothetical protein [Myxococcus sp. CA039A]